MSNKRSCQDGDRTHNVILCQAPYRFGLKRISLGRIYYLTNELNLKGRIIPLIILLDGKRVFNYFTNITN